MVDWESIERTGDVKAEELQRIAVRLSNSSWVRYWLHWNYPLVDPWMMAIDVREYKFDDKGRQQLASVRVDDLIKLGFHYDEYECVLLIEWISE